MNNVLFILTDQQRKDSIGVYGNPIVETPNLDALAQNSVRFNRCYVTNPICMPNRLSLFTGMSPRSHGLWTNGLLLENEVRTLGNELSERGYQTVSFGKIHFTPYGGDGGNKESKKFWQENGNDYNWFGPYWGFQHVELTLAHTDDMAHYGDWFEKRGGTPEMLKNPEPEPEDDSNLDMKDPASYSSWASKMPAELHDSSFVADRTINFLKNDRDKRKPFFAVASFPDPHHPFNPPEEIAKKYSKDNVIKPTGSADDLETRPQHYKDHFNGAWNRKGIIEPKYKGGISSEKQNEHIAHTYAMVDLIDQNIGKIIDALKSEGLMDNTIIIFTSDHGELLGDHGLWFKGPFFYEGLMNVPLIIHKPGTIPFISDSLVSSIDVMPTICELIGIPVPEYVNGRSQVPHINNPNITIRDKCLIEYRNGYGEKDCSAKALITKDMKYVRYQTGETELTDLKNDPAESQNVASKKEYKEELRHMERLFIDEILSTESRHPEQISHA